VEFYTMGKPSVLDSDKAWLSRDVFGCGCGVEFFDASGKIIEHEAARKERASENWSGNAW
jgi:hypothetical protein